MRRTFHERPLCRPIIPPPPFFCQTMHRVPVLLQGGRTGGEGGGGGGEDKERLNEGLAIRGRQKTALFISLSLSLSLSLPFTSRWSR